MHGIAQRTSSTLLGLVGLVAIGAVGCSEGELPPLTELGNTRGGGDLDGGTSCTAPEEGCACPPGSEPIDCYLPAERVAEGIACTAGARYCRDGRYTECVALRHYTLATAHASPLIGSLRACNECDPACQTSQVVPEQTDLVPERATNVVYDPSAGGIRLSIPEIIDVMLVDSDGDGVPDRADDCPADRRVFRSPCMDPTRDGFFHVLPYQGTPVVDRLSVDVRIQTADVYVLMDNTGSMGGEIANLRASLTSGTIDGSCPAGVNGGVLGAIRCAIPQSAFGVGFFREYGDGRYGDARNTPYAHVLDITESLSDALGAVSRMNTYGNVDVPEALTQALYATVTGSGLGRYVPNRGTCSTSGAWGYPCFRKGSIPIVITITDAMYHDGPVAGYEYTAREVRWSPATMPVEDRTASAGDTLSNESQATAMALGDLAHAYRSITGSTVGMTNDLDNVTPSRDCDGEDASDAVYRFSLSEETLLVIDTQGSSFDTSLGLRDASFRPIDGACNDESPLSLGYAGASMIVRRLPAGEYFVVVDGGRASDGHYRLNFRALDSRFMPTGSRTGERIESAIQLGTLPVDTVVRTRGSVTPYADDYGPWCGVPGQPEVVYELVVPRSGILILDTRGSNFDTVLALLDDRGRTLSCGDDSLYQADGRTSRVEHWVEAGVYRVLVEGRGDRAAPSVGEFDLHVQLLGPNGTDARPLPDTDLTSAANVPWATTLAALQTSGARVLGITSCDARDWDYNCDHVRDAARAVARATDSVDAVGNPLVYSISPDGTGLGATVVRAVQDLANYTRIGVEAVVADNPSTTFDERLLVNSVVLTASNASRCTSCSGASCTECLPGTALTVGVELQNDVVAPTSEPQVFELSVVVLADGSEITRVPIRVVVPARISPYATEGRFQVDYDSTRRCTVPPQRPRWGSLDFDIPSPIPEGTRILFELRFADRSSDLDTVEPALTFPVTPTTALSDGRVGTGRFDIDEALERAELVNGLLHLRVTARLFTNASRTASPTLHAWNLSFECVDAE